MENGHSMKQFFYLLLLLFLLACQTDNKSIPIPAPSESIDSIASLQPTTSKTRSRSLTAPSCTLKGNILPHNKLWLPNEQLIVCIAADSTTLDKKFGESHRKLVIYDTQTCEPSHEWTLPINRSPDFPYYLANLNYNNKSPIIAIQGANSIHCLHLNTKKLHPPVIPVYKTKRLAQDAQSGNILQLKLWEEFLIGYAQDMGTFVFKISKKGPLAPLLPYAEYRIGESTYQGVYLLPSPNNKIQAILPRYDWEEEDLSINTTFPKPVTIQTNIIKSPLNNQYIVLKTTEPNGAIGLDLKTGKKVVLPKDLHNKGVQGIIGWMKNHSSDFQPLK